MNTLLPEIPRLGVNICIVICKGGDFKGLLGRCVFSYRWFSVPIQQLDAGYLLTS